VNAAAAISEGVTALEAVVSGHTTTDVRRKLFQLLIDNGADVNSVPAVKEGRTAIEGSAELGRLDMVRFLLHHGAKGVNTAIKLADEHNHLEVARLLRHHENID